MKCYHCKSKKVKQTSVDEFIQTEFECGLIIIGGEESYTIIKECSNSQDWYYQLTEEQKASIQRGLKDIEEGRVISHEELQRQIREKFGF